MTRKHLPKHVSSVMAAVAALSLLAACTSQDTTTDPNSSPNSVSAGNTEDIAAQVTRFKAAAAERGYVVQDGMTLVTNLNDLYCQGKMWAPLYPNPNSPYISAVLPPVPGQAATQASDGSFRLREDEAVVVIGETPPPMAYFSFNVHMLSGSLNPALGPPVLWVPVTDPVNSLALHHDGDSPFEEAFSVVATGQAETLEQVEEMLTDAGLGAAINQQVISPSLFRLGLGADSDEFIFAMRTAMPDDPEEFDAYLAALREKVQVLRVRPQSLADSDQVQPVVDGQPLPVPAQRVAGTGSSELDLNPALGILRQRIVDAHPGYIVTDLPVSQWFELPYPGLQLDSYTELPEQDGVAGATTDAVYLASDNFALPEGAFIVAYGAHHRETGKATYSSVAVYADAALGAGLTTVQSPSLQGSARDYIDDLPEADQFYAWKFTRAEDSGEHVSQLPTDAFCAESGRPVDLDTLRVGFRAYAEPETQTRPSLSELLYDRLILFTPEQSVQPAQ